MVQEPNGAYDDLTAADDPRSGDLIVADQDGSEVAPLDASSPVSEIGTAPAAGSGLDGSTRPGAPATDAEIGVERTLDLTRGNRGAERLLAEAPAELFVMPIVDESGSRELPLESFRDGLLRGLVADRYTPLDCAFGDSALHQLENEGRATPLELLKTLETDGLLQVRVLGWNESALESKGAIDATAEALVVDPRLGGDGVLWGVQVTRRIELPARLVRSAAMGELRSRALDALARSIAEQMPERDPLALVAD